jgi:seryl-tRNA synthetase
MLDIRFIRENAEKVRAGVRLKGEQESAVDEALALDEERRRTLQKAEILKSRRNEVSDRVAGM